MAKRIGKYELYENLGEGALGKVKLAKNVETGEKVAIKILNKEKIKKQNLGEQTRKEIAIMKSIHHPNVVNLIETLASNSKIFIVLEYIPNGELFEYISSNGKLEETRARVLFHQLVDGVDYIHSLGICHRDLKPENLLFDKDNNLRISDFGLSAVTKEAEGEILLHTTCGSPNYVAPEVLTEGGYIGVKADIWSMGVILYVMLVGVLPFDEPALSTLFRKIQHAEYTIPNFVSAGARDLIHNILDPNPKTRYSIWNIRNHPWYQGLEFKPNGGTVMRTPAPSEGSLPIDPRTPITPTPINTPITNTTATTTTTTTTTIVTPIKNSAPLRESTNSTILTEETSEVNTQENHGNDEKPAETRGRLTKGLGTSNKNIMGNMHTITVFELINIMHKLTLERLADIASTSKSLPIAYICLCHCSLDQIDIIMNDIMDYCQHNKLTAEREIKGTEPYVINIYPPSHSFSFQVQILQLGTNIYILDVRQIDGVLDSYIAVANNLHMHLFESFPFLKLLDNKERL
ncbi:hypothetical protein WA158_001622 [Blastocystis sp. Blastoise]